MFIRTDDVELAVSPQQVCLEEGETETFEATDALTDEEVDVTWTAERGSISQGGTFTSPGMSGTDITSEVTASLVSNPDITATATVTTECSCWYDAKVVGDWSQSFSDRISEIQFDEDTQALEAIVFRNSIEDATYPKAELEFVSPVPAGTEGDFEARIEGAFAVPPTPPTPGWLGQQLWYNLALDDWDFSGLPGSGSVLDMEPVSVTIHSHEMADSDPAGDRFLSLTVDGPVQRPDVDESGQVVPGMSGTVSIDLDTSYTGLASSGVRQFCGTAP